MLDKFIDTVLYAFENQLHAKKRKGSSGTRFHLDRIYCIQEIKLIFCDVSLAVKYIRITGDMGRYLQCNEISLGYWVIMKCKIHYQSERQKALNVIAVVFE